MAPKTLTLVFRDVPPEAPNPFITDTPFGQARAASVDDELRRSSLIWEAVRGDMSDADFRAYVRNVMAATGKKLDAMFEG